MQQPEVPVRTPQPEDPAVRAPLRRAPRPIAPRDQTLTAWSIWSLLLASALAEIFGQTQLISLGFYTVHIVDPPVMLAFVAWGFCLARRRPAGGIAVAPALLIAALIMMNFARGMASDTAIALLCARGYLATAAILLLATTCSLSPRVERAFRHALIVSGGILAVVTLLRLIFGPGLFMLNPVDDADRINDGGRALASTGAFLLGLAATLLLSDIIRTGVSRSLGKTVLFLGYVAMEIASGQGTAAAATAAMIAVVLIIERGSLRGTRAVLGGIGVLMLAVVVITGADQLLQSQGGTFNVAHRAGNLETRETVWAALKVGFARQSQFNQLFGMPAGQMPEMIVYLFNHLMIWQLTAHSMYYGSLPLMGYVGLSAYIFLLCALSFGSLQTALRRVSRASPAYPLAMCVGTVMLSYTYEVRLGSLMGLFIAFWWFRAARSRVRAQISEPGRPGVSDASATLPPL